VTKHRPRYVVGALGGLALIGSSIGGLSAVQAGGPLAITCATRAATTTCTGPDAPISAGTGAEQASPYRDGAYTVVGHYETPGGSETIGVTLTLANGLVSDAAVQVDALSPTARQFQDQFASRYAVQVVGRDLSTVNVSRVAGASLTSVGFNRAVAEIKAAADG